MLSLPTRFFYISQTIVVVGVKADILQRHKARWKDTSRPCREAEQRYASPCFEGTEKVPIFKD